MSQDYVRLTKRLSGRSIVDPISTWSISGLDVKEVPSKEDYPNAARFVRDKINRGVLEYASRAEYEEVEEINQKSQEELQERLQNLAALGVSPVSVGFAIHQEGHVQEAARRRRKELSEAPDSDSDEATTPNEPEYDTWTNDKLREELDRRELETSGNKAELVARLQQDDGASDDE